MNVYSIYMKKLILLVIPVLLSASTYLTVAGYSNHIGKREVNHWLYTDANGNDHYEKVEKKFNQTHYSKGIYHDISDKFSVSFTNFKNSYNYDSYSLEAHRNWNFKPFKLSLNAGIVRGYGEISDIEYMPFIYPSISFEKYNICVELAGMQELQFMQIHINLSDW